MSARRRDDGQALVLMVLFLVSLLGMCALAIDMGQWYQTRVSLQAAADSAALAGASQLPVSQSAATTTATSEFGVNSRAGDTATATVTQNLVLGDSVTVQAHRPVTNFFMSIFGSPTTTINVTARATIESINKLVSHGNVMPWGVIKQTFVAGQSYTFYANAGGSPDNGAISLPVYPSCTASGANDYRNSIQGNAIACPVALGEIIPTKGGQNAGPTQQGVTSRITTFEPIGNVVQFLSSGFVNVLKPSSPQLVVLPIVTQQNGSLTFPATGSQPMVVVGFANFFITGVSQGGKQVTGIFVSMNVLDDANGSGGWDPNPGDNLLTTFMLTA